MWKLAAACLFHSALLAGTTPAMAQLLHTSTSGSSSSSSSSTQGWLYTLSESVTRAADHNAALPTYITRAHWPLFGSPHSFDRSTPFTQTPFCSVLTTIFPLKWMLHMPTLLALGRQGALVTGG